MGDLNRATLTGFVTDSAEVKFKPRKGKCFLVVRSDRFSGTPDDIIVEIPNRLKGTFREWNWIKVSGRIRSKWVRADHQEKKYVSGSIRCQHRRDASCEYGRNDCKHLQEAGAEKNAIRKDNLRSLRGN